MNKNLKRGSSVFLVILLLLTLIVKPAISIPEQPHEDSSIVVSSEGHISDVPQDGLEADALMAGDGSEPPNPPTPPTNPEDPCCPCYGKDPANDCDCPCHYDDEDDGAAFKGYNLGGNLYFGEWTIGDYGVYDSADDAQTTDSGTHTGIYLINLTSAGAKLGVSVSEFYFDEANDIKLAGAELTVNTFGAFQVGKGTNAALVTQSGGLNLSTDLGASAEVLEVPSASRVKASWSGVLDVLPGTAIYEGKAQATLTWTVMNVTP